MQEIIFPKSAKNLKKVYNRLQGDSVGRYVNREEILFLAIGGYNRTYELILAMGVDKDEIATFSNLELSKPFLEETHMKKVLYIKKINYVTSVIKSSEFSAKRLDLNVADKFEESMMIYRDANRSISVGRSKKDWIKPTVVILDDSSLNLQYDGHRFYYHAEIGFVQIRSRNADPHKIIAEIQDVEEADKMMFALYQNKGVDEADILDALNRLRIGVHRQIDNEWYLKPTEYKKIVGSDELASRLQEVDELQFRQLKSNKKIGKENARWVIIPDSAFEFKGFDYKDEEEIFDEKLKTEAEQEQAYEAQQQQLLDSIMFEELELNIQFGYAAANMGNASNETLHSFLSAVDDVDQEETHGIELLSGATTEEEYKHIKKHNLAYFLDGTYKDDYRNDDNYIGGRKLISIDVDEGNYTRNQIEAKLEAQNLFGLVYPTAKYYFDGSLRWRIILMADEPMTKDTFRETVSGVAKMLNIDIDSASKKISQLAGYPFSYKDVSIIIGTKVNVKQFQPKSIEPNKKIVSYPQASSKSLLDFNHPQAALLREALETGISEGKRNESYYQIIRFLRDTQEKEEFALWHKEASELEDAIKSCMYRDGLNEKEVEAITR